MPLLLILQAKRLLREVERTEMKHDQIAAEYLAIKTSRIANPYRMQSVERDMNAAWHAYQMAEKYLDDWRMGRNVWIHQSQERNRELILARIRAEREHVLNSIYTLETALGA